MPAVGRLDLIWRLTSWNPLGHSSPVTGLLYLYLYMFNPNLLTWRIWWAPSNVSRWDLIWHWTSWNPLGHSSSVTGLLYLYLYMFNPNLLTWRIWWAPNNDSKWQMGFNLAYKGLIRMNVVLLYLNQFTILHDIKHLQWSMRSVLAFSTQVCGYKPARSRWNFRAKKILSTPSFGGEVKPSVPYRRFEAYKRSLNLRGSRNLGKITTGHLSRPQFHLSLLGSLASLRTEAPGG